jgi:formylglycine-generating enzyme required for sulfatase activity
MSFTPRIVNGTPVIVPPMAQVAAGPFFMGSQNDPQAAKDEYRQQLVLGAYEIGIYPVTVAEYACTVQAGAVVAPNPDWHPKWDEQVQRLDHPVVNVLWLDAMAYLYWLRHVTGDGAGGCQPRRNGTKHARTHPMAGQARRRQ